MDSSVGASFKIAWGREGSVLEWYPGCTTIRVEKTGEVHRCKREKEKKQAANYAVESTEQARMGRFETGPGGQLAGVSCANVVLCRRVVVR